MAILAIHLFISFFFYFVHCSLGIHVRNLCFQPLALAFSVSAKSVPLSHLRSLSFSLSPLPASLLISCRICTNRRHCRIPNALLLPQSWCNDLAFSIHLSAFQSQSQSRSLFSCLLASSSCVPRLYSPLLFLSLLRSAAFSSFQFSLPLSAALPSTFQLNFPLFVTFFVSFTPLSADCTFCVSVRLDLLVLHLFVALFIYNPPVPFALPLPSFLPSVPLSLSFCSGTSMTTLKAIPISHSTISTAPHCSVVSESNSLEYWAAMMKCWIYMGACTFFFRIELEKDWSTSSQILFPIHAIALYLKSRRHFSSFINVQRLGLNLDNWYKNYFSFFRKDAEEENHRTFLNLSLQKFAYTIIGRLNSLSSHLQRSTLLQINRLFRSDVDRHGPARCYGRVVCSARHECAAASQGILYLFFLQYRLKVLINSRIWIRQILQNCICNIGRKLEPFVMHVVSCREK